MGGKFRFSVQGSHLAPFVGSNGTKLKIPSEIKQPLCRIAFTGEQKKRNVTKIE
jgi:hypothetical protein